MKRKAALLAAAALLALTGCAGGNSSAESSTADGTSAAVTEVTATTTKVRTTASTEATTAIAPQETVPGEQIALKEGAWYCVDEQTNGLLYYWVISGTQLARFDVKTGEKLQQEFEAVDGSFSFDGVQYTLDLLHSQQLRLIAAPEDGGQSLLCTWFRDAEVKDFHPFSEDELVAMAAEYYASRTNHVPEFTDIESSEGAGTVVLHLYDLVQNHTATCERYYIDRFSGSGTDALGGSVNLHEPAAAGWKPEVPEQETLRRAGDFCGLVYLGGVPVSKNYYEPDDEFYRALLADTGLTETYPYLTEIPETNYACTMRGTELWLVIPADPDARVNVTNVDPVSGAELGDVYRSYAGAPFLLKCNYSDIGPDVRITVNDGSERPAFSPYLSMEDGSAKASESRVRVFEGVKTTGSESPEESSESDSAASD
jgi:hypothetical protein